MSKLIFGVGINDADYMVRPIVNGKGITCSYYQRWHSMIRRCYDPKYQEKNPTYRGCSVVRGWLLFSGFRAWMVDQDWEGMDLDKDIIKPGNKVYSPENCCFITHELNSLLCDSAAQRGLLPQGICWHRQHRKYHAKIMLNSKRKHLGYFINPEAASRAYIKAKTSLILQAAQEQTEPLIANGLRLHAELLNN
jgi:hypothetical protein